MTSAGPAVVDGGGEHSYAQLDHACAAVARALSDAAGEADLGGARVAFHVPPGLAYVATLLGAWRAGGVAVPLCLSHPEPELAYVLDDTGATITVGGGSTLWRLAAERGATHVDVDALIAALPPAREQAGSNSSGNPRAGNAPAVKAPAVNAPAARAGWRPPDHVPDRPALILYTSGTTGRPKGVVLSHRNLEANVEALVEAWGWTPEDRIVHVLPLHHTHGIVNALLCALHVGAAVDMLPGFDAGTVWERLCDERTTLFMAVPTIYVRLIRVWEAADETTRERWSAGVRRLRLMVSGSAALPVPVLERWRAISGHTLLERYGMTEIGMALSNPLAGERRAGSVGRPLPGVEVRLVAEDGEAVEPGAPGELLVRGPAVFGSYWERPAETAAAFDGDWFRTGDVVVLEEGAYRILGRRSVDIIKTGGYKVSALEIESVLAGHPDIEECAVVGLPDADWGEAVCAALVSRRDLDCDELRGWARERIAPYKLPRQVRRVAELPKNAMGKVTKPDVRKLFGG